VIALVIPSALGGVATVYKRVAWGFLKDGINFKIYKLSGNVITTFMRDLSNLRYLKKYDNVIYVGSIPWFSSFYLTKFLNINAFLFVHGFIYHEFLSTILEGSLRVRLGATLLLSLYDFARVSESIKYYICHTTTACDMARVPHGKRILLPQFLLEEEVETYASIRRRYRKRSNVIRIVSYTSYAKSPRLLTSSDVISLIRILKKYTKKEFEFILIDPRREPTVSSFIKVVKPLPRHEFLRLLASSDIYLEQCIDEELRYGALEALAMGVPVAKLTHQLFVDRVDYNGIVVHATSVKELAEQLALVIDKKEILDEYGQRSIDYVKGKRTWNNVKQSLYQRLGI